MTVAKSKIFFEPRDDRTGLYALLEGAAFGKSFCRCEPPKVIGTLAGFGMDRVKVGLKSHVELIAEVF